MNSFLRAILIFFLTTSYSFGGNMDYFKISKEIELGTAKKDVIKRLKESTMTIKSQDGVEILYFTDRNDEPLIGHTTQVLVIHIKDDVVFKKQVLPGFDMTGPRSK